MSDQQDPPQFRSAKKLFEDFHSFEMRGSGRFRKEIRIPDRVPVIGPCKYVTYRSDKWNDGTHEYIHKITSFPRVKMAVIGADAPDRAVPKRVCDAVTVSLIGGALGFAAELPDGDEVEGTFPAKTEWYWSPTGKALYAINNKTRLLAVVWGGDLEVEPRGIIG